MARSAALSCAVNDPMGFGAFRRAAVRPVKCTSPPKAKVIVCGVGAGASDGDGAGVVAADVVGVAAGVVGAGHAVIVTVVASVTTAARTSRRGLVTSAQYAVRQRPTCRCTRRAGGR